MARTWRNERTDKRDRQQRALNQGQEGTKKPRMSDFARDYYRGKGYEVGEYCDESVAYAEVDHE